MSYECYTIFPYTDYGNGTLKDGGVIRLQQEIQPKEGWICPNCKQGVAPWKDYCDCAPTYEVPKTTG